MSSIIFSFLITRFGRTRR